VLNRYELNAIGTPHRKKQGDHMIIRKNQKYLVLRVGEYKRHSFINEHKAVIATYGYTWMLKLGKPIPERAINETVSANGVVIIRTPKKSGGKLYVCECTGSRNGEPLPDYVFPDYYTALFSDYYWISKVGSWFCIKSISELEEAYHHELVLVKNQKPLLTALDETRTTAMYVCSLRDIKI
jgi:hypothetical protein